MNEFEDRRIRLVEILDYVNLRGKQNLYKAKKKEIEKLYNERIASRYEGPKSISPVS